MSSAATFEEVEKSYCFCEVCPFYKIYLRKYLSEDFNILADSEAEEWMTCF